MNLSADIQVASEGDDAPDPELIRDWLHAVFRNQSVSASHQYLNDDRETEVCVRIVGREEIQQLNATYRDKDYPTNVLSFANELPGDMPLRHLGDIVICATIVNDEAQQQQKQQSAHWAHMVVHGALHLLGFDHENNEDVQIMEALETQILQALDFPPPYEAETPLQSAI